MKRRGFGERRKRGFARSRSRVRVWGREGWGEGSI
jgi:hypothetical protein